MLLQASQADGLHGGVLQTAHIGGLQNRGLLMELLMAFGWLQLCLLWPSCGLLVSFCCASDGFLVVPSGGHRAGLRVGGLQADGADGIQTGGLQCVHCRPVCL